MPWSTHGRARHSEPPALGSDWPRAVHSVRDHYGNEQVLVRLEARIRRLRTYQDCGKMAERGTYEFVLRRFSK